MQQVVRHHLEADRGGHADLARCGVGVQRRVDHGDAQFLRPADHGAAEPRGAANDDAAGAALHGVALGLIAVGDEDDVPLLHHIAHQLRAGADADAPAGDPGRGVAHHHLRVQGFEQVAVERPGLGEDRHVVVVHVGLADVLQGDDALKIPVPVRDTQRLDLVADHHAPCVLQTHVLVDPRRDAVLRVLELRPYVQAQPGHLRAEIAQDKFRLPVQVPGPPGFIYRATQPVFQPGIGDRGADRVRIRVPVPDHDDAIAVLVIRHVHDLPKLSYVVKDCTTAFVICQLR